MSRVAVCAEAVEWIGTPYKHQAALKGIGADCVGLIAGTARAVGVLPPNYQVPLYDPDFHLHGHRELYAELLEAHGCTPRALAEAQPADVLLFRFRPYLVASHAGLLLPDDQLVHAQFSRCVVRHHLNAIWRRRAVRAYVLPGVTG